MSVLDNALRLAQKSQGKTAEFYRLFLNSQVVVPIMDMPIPSARMRKTTKAVFTFRITLLKKRRILMAFDSVERLKAAIKKPTQFVVLRGRSVLTALPPDLYLLLNAGTPFAKMFLPKEIDWIKTIISGKLAAKKTAPAKPNAPQTVQKILAARRPKRPTK